MHVNDPDFCAVRTVGLNLSTRVTTVWHRAKAKANLLKNPLPETRPAHEPVSRLPYECVEIIIAHLARDLDALKACSLTCRSWHTITLPHLHHTLTLRREKPDFDRGKMARDKLKPLSGLHDLGLIPYITEVRVEQRVEGWRRETSWFVPHAFSRRDLRYFSAFANVHTLRLQNLEIYRFIPRIQRYFKHFSPTLRSVALFEPRCTPRQLSYFLTFFPNLHDVEIERTDAHEANTTTPDVGLVPLSIPKLQGRLALYDFCWAETWTHLIAWCGGLRFRHMDLRGGSNNAPLLLGACAETLETLRFNVTDVSAGKHLRVGLPRDLS